MARHTRPLLVAVAVVVLTIAAACTPVTPGPSEPTIPPDTTTTTTTSTTTTSTTSTTLPADVTAPVLALPEAIAATATAASGAGVSWDASATDDVDGTIPVSCTPGPGPFPVGDTVVTCSATDAAGNTATGSFTVTVAAWSPAVVDVSAGDSHTCAVLADGTAACWGRNLNGQLGNGTTVDSPAPVAVSGLDTAVAIDAGYNHTCALLADTTVRCWGGNTSGQLGNGVFGGGFRNNWTTPGTVLGLSGVRKVDLGSSYSCALLLDGTARCWGYALWGALGTGSDANSAVPLPVVDVTGATDLAVGTQHSCAVVAGGGVRCWGFNSSGQTGNYATSWPVWTPKLVTGLPTGAVAVSVGVVHSCALLADGTVSCWGVNHQGAIGAGSLSSSINPLAVAGVAGATWIDSGGSQTCVGLPDLTVRCWGDNTDGELGLGSAATELRLPTTAPAWDGTTGLDTGEHHTCALTAAATVVCAGRNQYGQLGDGTSVGSASPVELRWVS